jgi:hypothetical protein
MESKKLKKREKQTGRKKTKQGIKQESFKYINREC